MQPTTVPLHQSSFVLPFLLKCENLQPLLSSFLSCTQETPQRPLSPPGGPDSVWPGGLSHGHHPRVCCLLLPAQSGGLQLCDIWVPTGRRPECESWAPGGNRLCMHTQHLVTVPWSYIPSSFQQALQSASSALHPEGPRRALAGLAKRRCPGHTSLASFTWLCISSLEKFPVPPKDFKNKPLWLGEPVRTPASGAQGLQTFRLASI